LVNSHFSSARLAPGTSLSKTSTTFFFLSFFKKLTISPVAPLKTDSLGVKHQQEKRSQGYETFRLKTPEKKESPG
jgi:hypothetical protein